MVVVENGTFRLLYLLMHLKLSFNSCNISSQFS